MSRANRRAVNTYVLLGEIACILVLGIVLVVCITGFFNRQPKYTGHLSDYGLHDVGKLVTQEGQFTSVQMIKDSGYLFNNPALKVPFTDKEAIYSLDGRVTAGIDFEQIDLDVDEKEKKITVHYPAPEIYDVVPDEDSLTIYHDSTSVFSSFSAEELNNSRKAMVNELSEKAMSSDILRHAEDNAKVIMRALIYQAVDKDAWAIDFKRKA